MRRPQWFGPYRLLYRISTGGMAEIYRAVRRDGAGVQHVAIKRVLPSYTADPEFVRMLIEEARLTGLIEHPTVARVYEFGSIDDDYFMAMEYVDGVDMRSVVRRTRERDTSILPEYAVYVVEQALRGLHAAHEQVDADGHALEIIHRDVSPSNVLITWDGGVKLIDFGIAKARRSSISTQAGVIKGKVKYMSPEQTLGKRLDRRSDVFAAGAVLYELVAGNPPFHAPDDVALMEAIRTEQPDPPSHHSPRVRRALDHILEKALAKKRSRRFDTAEDFAHALGAYLEEYAPRFVPADLGGFMSRIFAREKMEAEERFSEYDLEADAPEHTPTGERQHYTRFVSMGRVLTDEYPLDSAVLDESIDDEREVLDQVEAWLLSRNRETADESHDDAGTGEHEEAPTRERPAALPPGDSDEGFWAPDARPAWVDETQRTLEMEALREGTDDAGAEADTGLYHRSQDDETTTARHLAKTAGAEEKGSRG